jgi:hypothetical protein
MVNQFEKKKNLHTVFIIDLDLTWVKEDRCWSFLITFEVSNIFEAPGLLLKIGSVLK